MCCNGFSRSHSLPFPCNQFPFLPIPIPSSVTIPIPIPFPWTYSRSHSHSHAVDRNIMNVLAIYVELECGPMPNLMVALPNIGGALCSTPQSLADAHYQIPCSNAPKTRNPLKFAGVPQTRQQISAVSRPKFTILLGHVDEVLLLNKFFFRLSRRTAHFRHAS